MSRETMPSKEKITKHWQENYDSTLKQNYCWGCGYQANVQRSHLHAHHKGGNEKCDNLILLCHFCHTYLQEDFAKTKEGSAKIKNMILDGMPFFYIKSNLYINKMKLGTYDNFLIEQGFTKEYIEDCKKITWTL